MKEKVEWYYPRKGDASRMLFTLRHTRREPLWFVSPKSTGKTTFLLKDLAPMAEKSASPSLPIYIGLGADRDNPLQVIQAALDKSLSDLKSTPWGRILATLSSEVEEIGVGEVDVKLRAEEKPEPPASAYLKLDRTMDQIARLSKKPVLLIFDDAHLLLRSPQVGTLCTCIRAMISSRPGKTNALFCLDSRSAAESLFSRPGAPFHLFGREGRFPPVDQDFVRHMSHLYQLETGQPLDHETMVGAFERLNRQPRALMSVLADMMADQCANPTPYVERALAEMHAEGDWSGVHESMSRLERQVLQRLAGGQDPATESACAAYAYALQKSFVPHHAVARVLDRLVEKQVLGRAGQTFGFLSDEYESWIRTRSLLCQGLDSTPALVAPATLSEPTENGLYSGG